MLYPVKNCMHGELEIGQWLSCGSDLWRIMHQVRIDYPSRNQPHALMYCAAAAKTNHSPISASLS